MHFWYKLFTYLVYPLASIYLFYRIIKKKEDPLRYKEKLSKITIRREDGFLIWFHVASVGEAMSILPLIENCVNEKKINKILITTITLSSGKILKKKFQNSQKVTHQFLPFDVPILTNKFLKFWKPNLSVFIDSEIWPNLILQISEKKIPLILVNGRITKKTFNRWKLVINFAKKIFQKFNLCIASNKESENFLKILGAKNVKNYGNLKFSKIKTDLNNKLESDFLSKIKNRKIWCAASTHPTEERLCANSHLKIKEKYNNILTIIIPRHINRSEKIAEELKKENLKVLFHNDIEKINDNTDILLVNSYGETLKFFQYCKCVFLGKSIIDALKNDSGQNPIEPARLGCTIFHGPNTSNFDDIYKFLNSLGIAYKVNNSEELSQSIVEELKKDKEKNEEIIKKIENYGLNTLNNVLREIKIYINS